MYPVAFVLGLALFVVGLYGIRSPTPSREVGTTVVETEPAEAGMAAVSLEAALIGVGGLLIMLAATLL